MADHFLGKGPFPFPERQFGLPCPILLDFPIMFSLQASRSALWWLACLIYLFYEFCKGKSHLGIFPDEPSVEVFESEEHLDISNLVWCQPVLDCGDPIRFQAHSNSRNSKPQKPDFPRSKLTFLVLAIAAEFLKSLQHLVHMLLVVDLVCAIDEHVVEVVYREVPNECPYTTIDMNLEHRRYVS